MIPRSIVTHAQGRSQSVAYREAAAGKETANWAAMYSMTSTLGSSAGSSARHCTYGISSSAAKMSQNVSFGSRLANDQEGTS